MFSFVDENGYDVDLSFEKNAFPIPSKHVMVLANKGEKWLLTKHPVRGIEFPGGKVEANESLMEAAKREMFEETGARIHKIRWFAEYIVHAEKTFCKTVFRAEIDILEPLDTSFETDGPLWMTLEEFWQSQDLSFHMKDAGMKRMLEWVINNETGWKYRTEMAVSKPESKCSPD